MLAFSIIFETAATSLLPKTAGFTHIPFTIGVLSCYLVSFYLMTLVLKVLPVGIVYATWSGLGIVLVSAAAYFLYKQSLDFAAILGLAFIVVGVVLVNAFSNVSAH